MKQDLTFINEKGSRCNHDLTVYALSTCGFCKKAIKFLKDNSIKFKYVYFDDLDSDLQNKIEETLKDKFDKRIAFPFLVIDDKRCLVGFNQEEWEEKLL
ncbi:MAG: glutaredoxin family protein [Proteobacteria bacterium]|nr:glutaredoxin family protein [Pseudomonadota bacterium]